MIKDQIQKENKKKGEHEKGWLEYPKFRPLAFTLQTKCNVMWAHESFFGATKTDIKSIGMLIMLYMEQYLDDYKTVHPNKDFQLKKHTKALITEVSEKEVVDPTGDNPDDLIDRGCFEKHVHYLDLDQVTTILEELATNTDAFDVIIADFSRLILEELQKGKEEAQLADDSKDLIYNKRKLEEANKIEQAILDIQYQKIENVKQAQEREKNLNIEIAANAQELIEAEREAATARQALEQARLNNVRQEHDLKNQRIQLETEAVQREQGLENIKAEAENERRRNLIALRTEELKNDEKAAEIQNNTNKIAKELEEQKQKTLAEEGKNYVLEADATIKKREDLFKRITALVQNKQVLGTVGGLAIMVMFFFKLIPYLLQFIFHPKPEPITQTSLPITLKQKIYRLFFSTKKAKSRYHLMAYNDDVQTFVDKEITKTKSIQKKNQHLKKGEKPYYHENILLWGPTGTGKTMLALEIAKCCHMDYVVVNTALLASMPVEKAVASIKAIFKYSSQFNTAVVIILEEIDAVFGSRSYRGNSSNMHLIDKKIVSTLLGLIDKKHDTKRKVIGTTNAANTLDVAVINRMTPQKVGLPDAKTLEKQLINYIAEAERKGTRVSNDVKNAIPKIAKLLAKHKEAGRFVHGMLESLRSEATFISTKGEIELAAILAYIASHSSTQLTQPEGTIHDNHEAQLLVSTYA